MSKLHSLDVSREKLEWLEARGYKQYTGSSFVLYITIAGHKLRHFFTADVVGESSIEDMDEENKLAYLFAREQVIELNKNPSAETNLLELMYTKR